jgi:hypothetical protein
MANLSPKWISPRKLADYYLDAAFGSRRDLDYALFHAIREGRVRVRFEGQEFDTAAAYLLCSKSWGPEKYALPPDLEISVDDAVEELREGKSTTRAAAPVLKRKDAAKVVGLVSTRDVDTVQPSKGGRPPAVDWEIMRSEALRLMDYHSDFDPSDPDWNSQSCLVTALLLFAQNRLDTELGLTTVRDRAGAWIREWRQSQQRGN